ncbi:hypothetical protein [Chryseobacterium flavum]|uniref:hypothetical protein n=1 Tax=Chryseobacterium flavum TaxID=415851 RepID=UPI002FD9C4CC
MEADVIEIPAISSAAELVHDSFIIVQCALYIVIIPGTVAGIGAILTAIEPGAWSYGDTM